MLMLMSIKCTMHNAQLHNVLPTSMSTKSELFAHTNVVDVDVDRAGYIYIHVSATDVDVDVDVDIDLGYDLLTS